MDWGRVQRQVCWGFQDLGSDSNKPVTPRPLRIHWTDCLPSVFDPQLWFWIYFYSNGSLLMKASFILRCLSYHNLKHWLLPISSPCWWYNWFSRNNTMLFEKLFWDLTSPHSGDWRAFWGVSGLNDTHLEQKKGDCILSGHHYFSRKPPTFCVLKDGEPQRTSLCSPSLSVFSHWMEKAIYLLPQDS